MTYTDVHMGLQKVPKSDFQSQFSMAKIIQIFLNFFFIDEYQFRRRFFIIAIFWKLQFLNQFSKMVSNFWPFMHLWKPNQKNIFILLIFLLKSIPCWLTSAKPHHWGHTSIYNVPFILGGVKGIILYFLKVR